MRHRVSEIFTKTQAGAVNADAVKHAVRTGKVDELERAGGELRILSALAALDVAVQIDPDRLARLHIVLEIEARAGKGDGFRGHHVLGETAFIRIGAVAERTDAIRITEREKTFSGNQRDAGIAAADTLMNAAHRLESLFSGERGADHEVADFIREDVQQRLTVTRRIDVTVIELIELLLQAGSVREVPVMRKHDAVRGIHVKRLRLVRRRGAACSGIAGMRNAGIPEEVSHVAGTEDFAHETHRFMLMEGQTVQRCDAGSILTAVLKEKKRVIKALIYGAVRDHPYNAAHSSFISSRMMEGEKLLILLERKESTLMKKRKSFLYLSDPA